MALEAPMELEEALALLDESLGTSTELQQPPFPSFIADWEPDLHWGILDDDIGAFGSVDTSAITVQATSETATANQLATRKKRKEINPNKARDERRFQLIELQDHVAELEFTLKRLQTIRSERPKRIGHGSDSSDNNNGVPPVWQEICARQLNRRLEAERENIRLKQEFEKEKQLVKSFEKLLCKRRAPTDTEPRATKHTRRTDIPDGYIERMAALIFKELADGVKMCYHKVESVFETKRPVPMNLVSHRALLDGGMKGMERKFYDRRTIPFDMRATGDAWWENWHNYRGQRFQDVAANEITESFGLEMSDFKTNTSATAYAQQISHRHIKDDRVVFVWDAYVEPFGSVNERVAGVYFLEQNYVLIQPEDWSSERGCFTSVSTCYVLTPHFLDPKLKEDAKTVAVINFLISALSTNVMAPSEMVETLLLDQALRQFSDR